MSFDQFRRMEIPPRLQDLYTIAATLGKELGRLPEGVLDPCGLLLEIPPRRYDYDSTPKTALTFAKTGGDGVHYSYFVDSSLPSGVMPIAMTVPMHFDQPSVIVADTFDEFFGLGYHVGWFSLEQLVYVPDETAEYLAQPDPDDCPDKTMLMEILRARLGIRPVALLLELTEALTRQYASFLPKPDG
jgi:hypothetical protein